MARFQMSGGLPFVFVLWGWVTNDSMFGGLKQQIHCATIQEARSLPAVSTGLAFSGGSDRESFPRPFLSPLLVSLPLSSVPGG